MEKNTYILNTFNRSRVSNKELVSNPSQQALFYIELSRHEDISAKVLTNKKTKANTKNKNG